jgi:hypothetical protein
MIKAQEYRFVSPVFNLQYKDKETGKQLGPIMFAAALTNRPFFDGMAPVVLGSDAEGLVAISNDTVLLATAVEVDELPDECFAFIRPGGALDADGKTAPRSLRFLPYRDKAGSPDVLQLRDALARLPQSPLTPEEQAQARKTLTAAMRAMEQGPAPEPDNEPITKKEETLMSEQQIRELLGIGPDVDIAEYLKQLVAKAKSAESAEAEVATMKATQLKSEATTFVDTAISERKLLPKQKEQAVTMYMKDPEGYKAYMGSAPVVGPQPGEKGAGSEETTPTITATEHAIAVRLGISDEDYIKAKAE